MTLLLKLSAWKNLIKRSFSPRNQIITISKFDIHTSECNYNFINHIYIYKYYLLQIILMFKVYILIT